MSEINHRKCYKQVGPTCGIYAFINAMVSFHQCKKHKVNHFAFELWEKAIDSNVTITDSMRPEEVKYSLVGEFASSHNIVNFLNDNKKFINQELENLSDKTFVKATCCNKILQTESKNTAYLVIIKSSKDVLHCICYKDNQILNKNIKAEKKAMNKIHRNGKIKNMDDLKALIEKARQAGCVNMARAKGSSLHWPCNAKENKKKIKYHECKYVYKANTFPPIEISYKEK